MLIEKSSCIQNAKFQSSSWSLPSFMCEDILTKFLLAGIYHF